MKLEEKITDATIDTASKLAGSIYSDVFSPAARRIGGALDTTLKVGLSPFALLDWGFEQSKGWLTEKISERQAATPQEFQQTPPSEIAVPLLLGIATAADNEDMRTLYAELLMKAMDSRTVNSVHPSYASVLGQLTPQEAFVLISFKNRTTGSIFIDMPRSREPEESAIENLFHKHCVDLGLFEPDSHVWLQNILRLRLLELTTYIDATYREADHNRYTPSIETRDERHLTFTDYGLGFIKACAPIKSGEV